MTKLFLAGATGLIGSLALTRALADPRVSMLVAPSRRPLHVMHDKLVNPIMDPANMSPDADSWQVDGAMSALGTTRAKAGSAAAFRAIDFDYALAIALRLRKGGAMRFALTSSLGADSAWRFLYPRTKGELEEAIGALDFPSLTILRPGFLDGNRAENRPMERIVGRMLRIAAPVLPASARASPATTVAAMLVRAVIEAIPGTHVVTSADIARA